MAPTCVFMRSALPIGSTRQNRLRAASTCAPTRNLCFSLADFLSMQRLCLILLLLGAYSFSGAHSLLAQQPAAADTVRLSLQEALARTLQVSPEVEQREAQRSFAEARRNEARASRFLTEFSLNTTHSLAPGLENVPEDAPTNALYLNPNVENDWTSLRPFNQIEVEFGQPVWTWGELSGNIRAARHGVDVEEAGVRQQELEVAFRTGEIYYNVLLTEALNRLADRAGNIVEQAEGEIQRLLDEGDESVDDADLFRLRITEQEYLQRVAEVRQQRELARSALSRQLFMPEGTVAIPDTNVLAPLDFEIDSLGTYMELALENRPELDQAEAGIAARSALVDVERSNYYPKLFLGGSLGARYAPGRYRQESAYVGDPFVGSTTLAGFRIQQRLNFFQTDARVEQAEAELAEVRHQQEGAQQLIRFEVEEAFRNLQIAEAAVEARDEQLRISGEWLRTEQINFDLGFGDTENLVRAVREDLELRISYNESVQRYNVAVLRLLRVIGLLNNPTKVGTLVDL